MAFDYNDIMDAISILSVIAFLVPFIMLQLHKISVLNPMYSLMNLIGSVLILITMVRDFNLAACMCNIVWGFFSLYGVFKVWIRGKTKVFQIRIKKMHIKK